MGDGSIGRQPPRPRPNVMDFKRKNKRRKDRVVTGIEPRVTPTSSPAHYHYTTYSSLKYFHRDAVYDRRDAALIRRGAKF